MIWPADNPYSAARVELGRNLFFDPRLSSNGKVSCAPAIRRSTRLPAASRRRWASRASRCAAGRRR